MKQLQIHNRINDFIKAGTVNASIQIAQEFINFNEDSKKYFFSKADEAWLEWFFNNGLFDGLKKKSEDPTQYGYTLFELEYLIRMVEIKSQLVADIILSISISAETFNPEVVDRFFWITGLLPPEQIQRILPKILSEGWVKLMWLFSKSGYDYQKMVEKLRGVKDYKSLLILSEIILTVREKKEFADLDRFSISNKLFYLGDVSATEIFESITDIENPNKEKVLKILLNTLASVVDLAKEKGETIFAKSEPFYLLDVDIFTLELDTSKRSYLREDIQNLVAACKVIIREILASIQNDDIEVRRIYTAYIDSLPDSLTCWRLKLYAITRYPELFKDEIRDFLFRVFNVKERYFEINSGAEYHQGLIAGFRVLDESIQREYVAKVIEYFGTILEDKDREKWRRRDGLEILTYIKEYLISEEIQSIEVAFGKMSEDSKMVPHPSIGKITSGFVTHRSPLNPGDFSIDALINLLKTDATPEALKEQYKHDDYINSRGAEGLGDAIKKDFELRKNDYLLNLNKFFDRHAIDPGYVYAILRQIEDMLRAKEVFTDSEQTQIINFFELIKNSGETEKFTSGDKKSYLADWITVHNSMADLLIEILAVMKSSQSFRENREKILSLIGYLFSIEASPSVDSENEDSSEPSHVAINSVRGQTFRAFVQFTYNDGDKSLSEDVKALYEHILDIDPSAAVRFTIGQFLASFYFRDVDFIKKLLPKIFNKGEAGKEKLYFATWEGYLSTSLYKELFDELQDYYIYAIKLNSDAYPRRKYVKDLDEMLAVHIALAYTYLDLKINDPLFNLFWKTSNETRHHEFVSFIGRTCITISEAGETWFKDKRVSKDKLVDFWDWIISTDVSIEPKVFSGFGFWINPDKEIIDNNIVVRNLPITLQKSDGDVNWEYGITGRIKAFAEVDPKNTLEIIRNFLLHDNQLSTFRRAPLFSIDHEIKEALEIIYRNESLREKVKDLINLLIEKGSSMFWGLKDVIKD